MKICLLNCVDTPRSEIFDVGYYLSKKGHEITILYPHVNKYIYEEDNIKYMSFPARFLPKIHYTIPNIYREYMLLYDVIKNEKYDIIQACDYDYLTSLGPIFVKKKLNTPILLTTDAFPGISWSYGNFFVDLVGKIYTYTLGKYILNSYDMLTFLYKDLSKQALLFGLEKKRISTIPNGVNLDYFNSNVLGADVRDKLDVKDNEKLILFVGRLALVKRLDILIELTKLLLKDGYSIKTAIIGRGPYEKMYKQMAESCKDIFFLGKMDKKDLPNYYAAADIFVLPSLSEGLPTVLLEAAACGKPIVASDVGGIPDIIIMEKLGFLLKLRILNAFCIILNFY